MTASPSGVVSHQNRPDPRPNWWAVLSMSEGSQMIPAAPSWVCSQGKESVFRAVAFQASLPAQADPQASTLQEMAAQRLATRDGKRLSPILLPGSQLPVWHPQKHSHTDTAWGGTFLSQGWHRGAQEPGTTSAPGSEMPRLFLSLIILGFDPSCLGDGDTVGPRKLSPSLSHGCFSKRKGLLVPCPAP